MCLKKIEIENLLKDIFFCILLIGMVICFFENANYVNEWDLTGDVTDGHYALYAEAARIIHDGELPLWSTLHGGMTEVGNPVVQAFYPVTNILCRVCYLEAEGYLSYSIIHYETLIHFCIFAIGNYFLIRVLKNRRLTAFFIAFLCSFTSCVFQMHGWLYIWGGLVYMPCIVGCAIKLMENLEKEGLLYCVLGGLFLGLSGLAAPTQGVLINIISFIIVYICYFIGYFRNGYKCLLKLTWRSFLCGFLGSGFMAVTLFPVAEFIMKAYRYIPNEDMKAGLAAMSYEAFIADKLTINDASTILFTYWGWWSIGMVLSALLLVGIFVPRKWNQNWFAGIGIIVFSLMYGCAIFITKVMYYVPFYNSIREPYLYTFMAIVGIAMISSWGLDTIIDLFEKKSKKSIGLKLFFFIIFLGIIGRETYQFRSNVNNRYCNGKVATNIINEINAFTKNIYETYITGGLTTGRILQWASEKGYPVNTAAVLGWRDLDAYMNPYYLNTYFLKSYVSMDKRLLLQNVEFIICSSLDDSKEEMLKQCGYEEIARFKECYGTYMQQNEGETILYQRKDNLNRYGWMVYEYQAYDDTTDIEQIAQVINSEDFDVNNSVLINKDTCKKKSLTALSTIKKKGKSEVKLKEFNHNSISFEVMTEENGVFVTSEVYSSGWKVYVDGKRVDLLQVNVNFRGVYLGEGKHTVKFKYIPISFMLGIVYMVVCLGISIGLIVVLLTDNDMQIKFLKRVKRGEEA